MTAYPLKLGHKSPDVMDLQTQLGFTGTDIDGDFGPKTEAAVRGFQATHNLKVDGIVGPKTAGALELAEPQPTVFRQLINMFRKPK